MKKRLFTIILTLALLIGTVGGGAMAGRVLGDTDGDGVISNVDIVSLASFCVDLYPQGSRNYENVRSKCDLNRDGSVDNLDLVVMARIVVNIIAPIEEADIFAAVFWCDFDDYYLAKIRTALDILLYDAGMSFTDYDAAASQGTQIDQIDTAISQGANLLIVNIVESFQMEPAQSICDKAKAAGIPIIFFDREVPNAVINSYDNACYVGIRAAEAGEKQGQMAGEYIAANYDAIDLNKDGIISYIMMKGELGNPEADFRTEYSVEFCNAILEEAGKPHLAFYDPNEKDCFLPSNWLRTTAFELMEVALSTNPVDGDYPIEVAFANNDDAALGVVDALNDVGWNKGDPSKTIPVFGIDYMAEAAEAIAEGRMTGSILQSADGMARTVYWLAENVSQGNRVFDGAEEQFNTDEGVAKIRVPYEIVMAD